MEECYIVEIKFHESAKRALLKRMGFRWHVEDKFWYLPANGGKWSFFPYVQQEMDILHTIQNAGISYATGRVETNRRPAFGDEMAMDACMNMCA